METALVPKKAKYIQFYGDDILTIQAEDDQVYAPVKPLCQNIGIKDLNRQYNKIRNDGAIRYLHMPIPSKGGPQEALCILIDDIPLWLASTTTSKVDPAIKDKLILYKRECAQALRDYWFKGYALNPRFAEMDETRKRLYQDLDKLQAMAEKDPNASPWIYERMQHMWDSYIAYYDEPRVGLTTLSDEIFREYFLDKKYSKEAMREVFPLQLTSDRVFEDYRKRNKIRPRKDIDMLPEISRRLFRDRHQHLIQIEGLLRKYPTYTRKQIMDNNSTWENDIIRVLADNELYDIERFNEKSYADYRKKKQWTNKKEILIFPSGPFDTCWLCGRPISVSTVHLHHLTYARVGHELWTDFQPLCAPCHAYVHADKIEAKRVAVGGSVSVSGVTIIEERPKALKFTVNGETYWTPKKCVLPDSPAQKLGDRGILILTKSIAVEKGLA